MALWKPLASRGRAVLPSITTASVSVPRASALLPTSVAQGAGTGAAGMLDTVQGLPQPFFCLRSSCHFFPLFDTLILLAEQSTLSTVRKERILQTLQGLD